MWIEKFIQYNYSDQRLAEVLAHAQDGKLAFHSCCCLVGAATAEHPLEGRAELFSDEMPIGVNPTHLYRARKLPYAKEAEQEFGELGTDYKRCFHVIPLLVAEIARREQVKRLAITTGAEELKVDAPALVG